MDADTEALLKLAGVGLSCLSAAWGIAKLLMTNYFNKVAELDAERRRSVSMEIERLSDLTKSLQEDLRMTRKDIDTIRLTIIQSSVKIENLTKQQMELNSSVGPFLDSMRRKMDREKSTVSEISKETYRVSTKKDTDGK